MIINHSLKLIFVKTKKTAGTSFEIAFSKFCGANDIITPITPKDEDLRRQLGFRGAQNFKNVVWHNYGLKNNGNYYNHMSTSEIKATVPDEIFKSYKKITIYRNPFDYAISRYFWEGGAKTGLNFLEFLEIFPNYLLENKSIAPLEGDDACDVYLRYECLEEDMQLHGLQEIWQVFHTISAKSGIRPSAETSISELYSKFPEAIKIVNQHCANEIDFFGYSLPVLTS
jgi:hypothetical protein